MANVATPRGQIVVDDRGRTSLQKVRRQRHDRYTCTEHPDGTIVLVPVISLSPAEVAELRGLPHPDDAYLERR